MLPFIVAALLSQPLVQNPNLGLGEAEEIRSRGGRVPRVGGRSGPSLAFFEFAPLSGAGMGAPCACTTPTGARGEVMTFTRASNATCTKTAAGGLATTGIASGDLVVCSANQPRVEYDGAGVLGLRVEASRQNVALRSQEMLTAPWAKSASATWTADQATAPDGTNTADAFTFVSGGSESAVYQAITRTAAKWSDSVYVRGNGQSGTIDVVQWLSSASVFYSACSYNPTTWTRCAVGNNTLTAASWYLIVGCEPQGMTSSCTTNPSVFLWGAQAEAGAYLTSYVATTSAAATRSAETSSSFVNSVPVAAGSSAASLTGPAAVGLHYLMTWGAFAEGPYSAGTDTRCYDGTTQVIYSPVSYSPSVAVRNWCSWSGSTMIAGSGSSSASGAFDGVMGTGVATLTLGGFNQPDGIISRVCADPSPARCR